MGGKQTQSSLKLEQKSEEERNQILQVREAYTNFISKLSAYTSNLEMSELTVSQYCHFEEQEDIAAWVLK